MYPIDIPIISAASNHVYRFWHIWIFHFVMPLAYKRGDAKDITSFDNIFLVSVQYIHRYSSLYYSGLFLLNIKISCNLVIVTGMRCIIGYIGSGNHTHFQEGTIYKCVIVQHSLLHLNGQLSSLVRIKCLAHLCLQLVQLCTVVFSLILCCIRSGKYGKPVFRIACGTLHIRHSVHIPGRGFLYGFDMICRAVNIYLDTDLFQRSLRGLCQKRKLLTARIGQLFYGKLLTVLFTNAVTVTVCPSCILQNLLCPLRIIALSRDFISAESKTGRECTVCGVTVAIQKNCNNFL